MLKSRPSRALRKRCSAGFTLVELMVGLSIVAVLIALGAPSFATHLQNSKLASAANSYYSGVQMARAEAIRRNVPVQFVLTSSAIDTGDLANAAALATNGPNWLVRALVPDPDPMAAPVYELVEAKSAVDGAFQSGGTAVILVAGSAVLPAAFDGSITFNGFGGTTAVGAFILRLTNPAGGACVTSGGIGQMRCLEIHVAPGGQARVCDPVLAAPDSRAC